MDCQEGLADVFKLLESDTSVQAQIKLFEEKICPYFPPQPCQQFLLVWPDIQTAWLNDSSTAKDFCVDLGMCSPPDDDFRILSLLSTDMMILGHRWREKSKK